MTAFEFVSGIKDLKPPGNDEGSGVIDLPVVLNNQARIRTQMSAAHTTADLDHAFAAFTKVGRELRVIA